ncbi:hypothetical protein BLOT_008284 [Blomia tropicalis]|nr:hypothetical protein BLOT_008284 [Blomia tropicalis]
MNSSVKLPLNILLKNVPPGFKITVENRKAELINARILFGKHIAPSTGVKLSRSTAITAPVGLGLGGSNFKRCTKTWVQEPGAAPHSITIIPGFSNLYLSSI